MKKFILGTATLIFFAVMSVNAQETSLKIGYTDAEYILSALPEAKAIQSELSDYSKQLESQLQSKVTEFQTKLQDYQQNGANLLPEIRADKEQELQLLQQSIQQFEGEAQQSLQKRQVEKLQPVYDKIQKAIDAVRTENGYDMIFSARPGGISVLLSADEKFDISDLVFQKLGVTPPELPTTTEAGGE